MQLGAELIDRPTRRAPAVRLRQPQADAEAFGGPEMTAFADLEKWYASNCDGAWEEEFGVQICTLRNPGWMVSIDLTGTNVEHAAFSRFEQTLHDESDWISCRVEDKRFLGSGDPSKLDEIIAIFVRWVRTSTDNWLEPPSPLSPEELRRAADEEFWFSLGEEIGPELCTSSGCPRKRIALSVKCRAHHFEMVKRRRLEEPPANKALQPTRGAPG